MDNYFTLSVIIPVYNCERFVEKAIASVMAQPEVTEIIVVNDGSTDASQTILDRLQLQNPILKLFHHENKLNNGRSASRNLGIQKATGNYIAFLDADDYYLPNRFANDVKIFQENENYDGVYNAVGLFYYRRVTFKDGDPNKLDTVTHKIEYKKLFDALLHSRYGHFHIDGLTVKKSVFRKTGLFNMELLVAEDTDLLWKMAIKCRLESGIIDKALAVRGIHDTNVFNRVDLYDIYTIKMYESLLKWCSNHKVVYKIKDDLLKRIWIVKHKEKNTLYVDIKYWFTLFVPNVKLLFSSLSIKYFPLIRYRQMLFPFLNR